MVYLTNSQHPCLIDVQQRCGILLSVVCMYCIFMLKLHRLNTVLKIKKRLLGKQRLKSISKPMKTPCREPRESISVTP